MTENHFATLGLKAGAREDEIKKAFRSLAKTWHPDNNKNAGAEQKFKEIVAAYQYLQSKDRRDILERELNKKQYPPPAAAPFPNTTPGSNTTRKPASKDTAKKPFQEPDISGEANPSYSQENWKKDTSQKTSTHWTDSFRNTKNKKRSQGSDWKPWNTHDWADDFDAPTASSIAGLSAAFNGFRTLVNNFEKELESFLGKGSQFPDIFETVQPKFKKHMQPRFVATEHGYSGGLDEEYLFSPHSAKNGKTHKDNAPFSDDDSDGSFEEDNFQHCRNRDWRSSHQDVLNKIRQDRKAYQAKLKREASEEHSCEWCGRTFTLRALDRHVPICKQHVKRYGKPMTQHSFGASQKSSSFTMEEETGAPKATRPSSTCASDSDMTSDDSSPTPQRRPQSGGSLHAKSKTTKTSFSKEKLKTPSPSESQAGERSPGSYDSTQETNRQRNKFPFVLKGRQFPAAGFKR